MNSRSSPAIAALQEAQATLRSGQTPDAGLYRRIIEVIEMQPIDASVMGL